MLVHVEFTKTVPVYSNLHIGCRDIWHMSWLSWAVGNREVLPAGSHRLTAALNNSSSILACRLSPVMQKHEGKKKNSNNVCWLRGAEAITENTFRQIANMRSKVTVESEGSNITAIWLIAAPLVTEASHRLRTNSLGEQRGRKTSSLARWGLQVRKEQCTHKGLRDGWHV